MSKKNYQSVDIANPEKRIYWEFQDLIVGTGTGGFHIFKTHAFDI